MSPNILPCPRSLKILFYFHDLEINNQQTRRKDKLAVFHFQLGNLYSKYKSKLKSMNLLALVENLYLKKYSIDAIWKHFNEELQILVDGLVDFELQNGIVYLEVLYLRNYRHSGQSVSLCVVTRNLWVKPRECCHHVADFEEIQAKFREEDFQLCN